MSAYFNQRNLLLLVVCLLLVFLPVVVILTLAGQQSDQQELVDFRLGDSISRRRVVGSGLDIPQLRRENLLENGSFEPLVYTQTYLVSDGDRRSMTIRGADQALSSDRLPLDDFFIGAEVEVLTGQRETWQLKKRGQVTRIQPVWSSDVESRSLPKDRPPIDTWSLLFEDSSQQPSPLLLAGGNGYLIPDVRGDITFLQSPGKSALVQAVSWPQGPLLLDAKGDLYQLQADRRLVAFTPIEEAILDVTAVGATTEEASARLLCLLADERLVLLDMSPEAPGDFSEKLLTAPPDTSIQAIFSDDQQFYLLTRGGDLWCLSDDHWEMLWQAPETTHWTAFSRWRNYVFLAGDDATGQLIDLQRQRSRAVDWSDLLPAQSQQLPLRQVLLGSDRRLILLDTSGQGYTSRDGGEHWQKLAQDEAWQLILFTRDQSLLCVDREDHVTRRALEVRLVLDEALNEGHFQAGDQLQMKQVSPLPWWRQRGLDQPRVAAADRPRTSGDWYVSESCRVEVVSDVALTAGGQGALSLKHLPETPEVKSEAYLRGIYTDQLLADAQPAATDRMRLCYPLSAESLRLVAGMSTFEVSFWAKAADKNACVDIALTGPQMPYEPLRRYLTPDWQKHTLLFVVPWTVVEHSDLRLTFDFFDSSEVLLDNVQLSRSRLVAGEPPLQEFLENAKPSVLRLSYLPIGHPALPEEFYFASEGQMNFEDQGDLHAIYAGTLVEANRLLEQADASPWLCLESGVTETELRHLMQYLFGSRQTDYGQRRIQDGSYARWSELYDRIYFEFCESEAHPPESDQERKRFVNWALEVMSSCPEYNQVKNQIFFIDGLRYTEGSFLSQADSHAANFGLVKNIATRSDLEDLNFGKQQALLRDPLGMTERPVIYRGLLDHEVGVDFADYLSQYLVGLGDRSVLSLPTWSEGEQGISLSILTGLNRIAGQISGLSPREVRFGEAAQDLVGFAYDGRQGNVLCLINLGKQVRSLGFRGKFAHYTNLYEYNSQGSLIRHVELSQTPRTISLLPGSVIVFDDFMNQPEE